MRHCFTHHLGKHYEGQAYVILYKHMRKWGLLCVSGGIGWREIWKYLSKCENHVSFNPAILHLCNYS